MIGIWLLSCFSLAYAGRIERIAELSKEEGGHAEVVETVTKWEKAGSLGDEEEALIELRDRSALAIALAVGSTQAIADFRATYPTSKLLAEALEEEEDLAMEQAQDEGTSAAMRSFLQRYPASKLRAQALVLEDGLAFQEAAAIGTFEAIEEFRRYHLRSPYLATAWEAIAAHTPGIHLLLPDGRPYLLPATPVVDDRVKLERSFALGSVRPTAAVNLPGAGRGTSSAWWGLAALSDDGGFLASSPIGLRLGALLGAVPPGLLDLAAASGAHTARVSVATEPLVAPGLCIGEAKFAYLLTTPDGGRTAFPFAIPCEGQTVDDTAATVLIRALEAAEAGQPGPASQLWDRAMGLSGASRLEDFLGTLPGERTELKELVTRRPAAGDVLAWDGAQTTWWHDTGGEAVALGKMDGLWWVDGARLWKAEPVLAPWTASASGGCKAATGERTSWVLRDVFGTEQVAISFEAARGGTLTIQQVDGGGVVVIEEGGNVGCTKPAAAVTRTIPLAGAVASVPGAWAPVAEAKAVSVVGEGARTWATLTTSR